VAGARSLFAEFVSAWLGIKKHQSPVVTPHHPVASSRKQTIKPGPTANLARFDGTFFLGYMVHALHGL
jgi:hypothetical protein